MPYSLSIFKINDRFVNDTSGFICRQLGHPALLSEVLSEVLSKVLSELLAIGRF